MMHQLEWRQHPWTGSQLRQVPLSACQTYWELEAYSVWLLRPEHMLTVDCGWSHLHQQARRRLTRRSHRRRNGRSPPAASQ